MASVAKPVHFAVLMFLFLLIERFVDDPTSIAKNIVVSAVGAAFAWGGFSLFLRWSGTS